MKRPEDIPFPATLRDLFAFKGKAELIAGRVVVFPLMGHAPGQAKMEIMGSLDDYSREHGIGEAFGGSLVYAVPRLPNGRESFCPDASYHTGPWPEDRMSWVEGAPVFAVEVRVLEDYSNPSVEQERAAKRADYFLAGTRVVWDVDPVAETVSRYNSPDPIAPAVFRRGDVADAEPALPGWRLQVDDVFG